MYVVKTWRYQVYKTAGTGNNVYKLDGDPTSYTCNACRTAAPVGYRREHALHVYDVYKVGSSGLKIKTWGEGYIRGEAGAPLRTPHIDPPAGLQ